jgi:hypothetical protein
MKHHTKPFSEPQPQMPVLSALQILINIFGPSSCRLPVQVLASQHFSPFARRFECVYLDLLHCFEI